MRVLLIVHEDLLPPKRPKNLSPRVRTEYEVYRGLVDSGHEVSTLGIRDSLSELRRALHEVRPHIVFNLLEEFAGKGTFEPHVVSYLELMNVPYTGCNAKGLHLAKDKAVAKTLLRHHQIKTPNFLVVPRGKRFPKTCARFPMIVKAVEEEASRGITVQSVVWSKSQLDVQVLKIHEQIENDALVEEFIDGREFYLGLMGNTRLTTFPVWELNFGRLPQHWPRVATEKIKWREDVQKKYFVDTGQAENLTRAQIVTIRQIGRKAYGVLGLSGYARMDFRMDGRGQIYFLEANPNPNIGAQEDFAVSAKSTGVEYPELLDRILRIGRQRYEAQSLNIINPAKTSNYFRPG